MTRGIRIVYTRYARKAQTVHELTSHFLVLKSPKILLLVIVQQVLKPYEAIHYSNPHSVS